MLPKDLCASFTFNILILFNNSTSESLKSFSCLKYFLCKYLEEMTYIYSIL